MIVVVRSVGLSTWSSAAATSTDCGVLQSTVVKVRLKGGTVATLVSPLATATVTSPVGWLDSATEFLPTPERAYGQLDLSRTLFITVWRLSSRHSRKQCRYLLALQDWKDSPSHGQTRLEMDRRRLRSRHSIVKNALVTGNGWQCDLSGV